MRLIEAGVAPVSESTDHEAVTGEPLKVAVTYMNPVAMVITSLPSLISSTAGQNRLGYYQNQNGNEWNLQLCDRWLYNWSLWRLADLEPVKLAVGHPWVATVTSEDCVVSSRQVLAPSIKLLPVRPEEHCWNQGRLVNPSGLLRTR